MASVLVIVGHPRKGSFCEALGRAYVEGAEAAGHEARILPLAELSFDPILHNGFGGGQALEPDLVTAQDAIRVADHVVFVWPLWFGTMPALLKGFIERVFTLGFAVERRGGPVGYRPLLTGKSARIVVTMQMPTLYYRFFCGARAARTLRYNILEFVGMKPVRRTLFGMIDHVDAARRARWIEEMRGLGAKAE